MGRFSLSAVGRDRPGIVAAVTGVLADHGGNLQDSTMATLQGQFAIVLIVSAPPGTEAATIEADLQAVAERFDLVMAVRALHEDAASGEDPAMSAPAPTAPGAVDDLPAGSAGRGEQGDGPPTAWSIAVHGSDRPGIVHGVTSALADIGGNIVDLATHLVGEPDAPVYALTLRATVPNVASSVVIERLQHAADTLGVHCTVRLDDADVL